MISVGAGFPRPDLLGNYILDKPNFVLLCAFVSWWLNLSRPVLLFLVVFSFCPSSCLCG